MAESFRPSICDQNDLDRVDETKLLTTRDPVCLSRDGRVRGRKEEERTDDPVFFRGGEHGGDLSQMFSLLSLHGGALQLQAVVSSVISGGFGEIFPPSPLTLTLSTQMGIAARSRQR